MKINLRYYIWYKLLNSLFLGLSIGSIFVIYTPLKPSIYSIGGIVLAIGMLILAKFYEKMMHKKIFFYITLFVELVVLFIVTIFLIFNYSYVSALWVYAGYQLTFIFGNYLVRMETIALQKASLLSFVDVAKQKGYLGGLVLSYLFYKGLESLHVKDKQLQVYDLHVGLFLLQLLIIFLIFKSFRRVY